MVQASAFDACRDLRACAIIPDGGFDFRQTIKSGQKNPTQKMGGKKMIKSIAWLPLLWPSQRPRMQ
jgi:hypothetical protein